MTAFRSSYGIRYGFMKIRTNVTVCALEKNTESYVFIFENVYLENSKEEAILGISIDNKLTFDNNNIKSICRKAGGKLSALSRISLQLETNEKELLFKSMGKSQLSYCPFAWRFC